MCGGQARAQDLASEVNRAAGPVMGGDLHKQREQGICSYLMQLRGCRKKAMLEARVKMQKYVCRYSRVGEDKVT